MQSSIISVFLAKINAARQGHFVSIKVELCTKTMRLLKMFQEVGIIRGYHVVKNENRIKVMLKYVEGSFNIFKKVILVSRPGRKVYVDIVGLYKLKEREGGTVIYILSTPKGVLFDSECLIRKIGGEVLVKIII
jgi:ribosomal protein S8